MTRRTRFAAGPLALLSAAVLVTLPSAATSPALAADDATWCSSLSQDLHQRSKPVTGANLLTRTASEARSAETRYGFSVNDGTLARVAGAATAGLHPVHRLYRQGQFAWAGDGPELAEFVAAGYVRQKVDFWAADQPGSCVTAYYQLERGGVHRVAAEPDVPALVEDGWTRGEVSFYAAPADPPPAAPSAPAPVDPRFSFAVLPDTQMEVHSPTDQRFSDRIRWLTEQRSALDLRFALHVGDLVDWGHVEPAQFDKVSRELRALEAVLPWAGAVGNHDTAAVCRGGSACPGADTRVTVRNTTAYNAAFPPSRFPALGGTFEPGKVDNSWSAFTAGGVEWLVLNLELWPRPAAVEWGRSVVAAHPRHNVVVLTHAYLEGNGSLGQDNGGYGSTSPQYLHDRLVTAFPNVRLVLSGHTGEAASRTEVGPHGNTVVSLLQTFHSTTNPVRVVEVDTAAGTITSTVHAPSTGTDYPQHRTSAGGISFVR